MQTPDSASTIDNTPAPVSTLVAILNNEGTQVNTPDNTSPALATPADNTPAVPTAVEIASTAIAQIEAALAVLASDNPARAALTAALDTANGQLALAQADAALESQKQSEIDAAKAVAVNLPTHLLDAMLAEIDKRYAPAAPAVESPAPAAPAPYNGRKQPSARTVERNTAALAVMASDPTVSARLAATYTSWRKDWASDVTGVNPQAGTRYVSMVCLSGAGVANRADYQALVPQMRSYMLALGGYREGGNTYASDAWLFAFGPHAADGPKAGDTLYKKFLSRAELALHADGRFRLTAPSTAGVRYVRFDNAAMALWVGGAAPAVPTPAAPQNMPAAPIVPTPPATVALPNGSLATTARCQHCVARNIVGQPACTACGAADWHLA